MLSGYQKINSIPWEREKRPKSHLRKVTRISYQFLITQCIICSGRLFRAWTEEQSRRFGAKLSVVLSSLLSPTDNDTPLQHALACFCFLVFRAVCSGLFWSCDTLNRFLVTARLGLLCHTAVDQRAVGTKRWFRVDDSWENWAWENRFSVWSSLHVQSETTTEMLLRWVLRCLFLFHDILQKWENQGRERESRK